MRNFWLGDLLCIAYFYLTRIRVHMIVSKMPGVSIKVETGAKQLGSLGNSTRLQIFRLSVRATQTAVLRACF